MKLSLGFSLVILFINFAAYADVKLFTLRPSKSHLEYLIPVREGYRFIDELNLYKNSIRDNSDLSSAVTIEQLEQFKLGQVRELNNERISQVLILANRGLDLGMPPDVGGQARIKKLSEKLSNSTSLVVMPLAIGIHLNDSDRIDLYEKISLNFSGVIALGGADVSPDLYNEENSRSRDINLTRDKFEIEFLKHWIKKDKGFLYGICRGHQLIAVALGFKLIQHIDSHGDKEWENHKIIFQETRYNIFKKIFNTKLLSIRVNSYHHQAVQFSNHNPEIELAAVATDGVAESLVSKDGRIFTTQFHPEFMNGFFSKRFFSYLNNKFKGGVNMSCQHLFRQ